MKQTQGYHEISIDTGSGQADARYFPAHGATRAVVFVAGAIGGWHSPAHELYIKLATVLNDAGVSAMQVKFRDPHDLVESTRDVLAGIEFLYGNGVRRAGLVGHSFGGAVVILAAARSHVVRTVVALSTQSYGAVPAIYALRRRCSIFLAHGLDDEVLPSACSEYVHDEAMGRKKLLLLPGTRHGLDEAADELYAATRDWLLAELS